MYRNIIYNGYAGTITEFTWDEDGNPAEYSCNFKPYVYVETGSERYDAVSIFNTKLRKIEFKNEKAKYAFVERNEGRRIFYNLPAKQQYLIEKYKDKSLDEMMKNPLRVFYLDIEVYSPDVFPEADQAKFPINVITLWDTTSEKFYTWGLGKDYDPSGLTDIGIDPNKIFYINCSSEVNLLESFIRFWSMNYPDVVTNWNGSTFDIPYLINRMTSLLGEDAPKKLSPNNYIYSKIKSNIFDRYYTHWVIDGIADIDYLELYAKFESRQHESYKLDYVGNNEGIDGKVAYEAANLAQLADEDWNTFVTYNIQDVNIIRKLEDKKNYLKIARAKAYRGLSPLDKAMDSVPIVTGLIAKTALEDNKIIITNRHSGHGEEFDGGFVFKPTGKMHKGVVSFDVNSLYPNTMITLNTSPETKVGTVSKSGEVFVVRGVNGKIKELSEIEFKKVIKDHNLVLTKANVLFSQKKMGICPKFLDDLYKDRVRIKKEMETESDPKKLEAMDLEQYLLKILLNSVYGVFGNKYFALYDVDIAKSVTLTGQAMIKQATEIVKNYSKEKLKDDDFDMESIVVYGDTDSSFFDFDKVLTSMNIPFFEEEDDTAVVTPEAYEVIKEYETMLNERINEWAKKSLNSNDPRYKFSREKICYMGMFITKKNYILRVVDDEGSKCDKLVERGVELVKSSHSEEVKNIMRGIIKNIFYNKGKSDVDDLYIEGIEKFKELPTADIALRKNVKDHEKWLSMANGFNAGKGTPAHHKGTLYYNKLISDMGLDGKYQKISSGQKIKFLYIEPNKYGFKYICFPDELPPEFGFTPDYNTQYNKMVSSLIARCYNGLDWIIPDLDDLKQTDLGVFLGLDFS